jgi:hypothetical protein
MDDVRSRSGILVGVAAAAGAFGAAVMMSAAAAPAAHADETAVINAVDVDYADGTAALTTANTDFSGGDFAQGLAALFDGVDDDAVVAPQNFLIGTTEVLANEPLSLTTTFDWSVPANFSDALSNLGVFATYAASDFSTGATDLSGGDYGDALVEYAYGLNILVVDPLQELLLGAAASF